MRYLEKIKIITVFILIGIPLIAVSAFAQQVPKSLADSKAAAFIDKMRPAGLLFIENKGQIRDQKGEVQPDILFLAKAQGCKVLVRSNGLCYQFEKRSLPEGNTAANALSAAAEKQVQSSTHRVDMQLLGANPRPTIRHGKAMAYNEHYYNIPDIPEGITGVCSFEKICLEEVYSGIDWVLYSKGQGIKYDFIIQPGADPSAIQMDYSWADELKLNPDGSLSIFTSLGVLTEEAPVCYQGEREIQSRFVLEGTTVSIAVEAYDLEKILVIDPCVLWSTYYGGPVYDRALAVATDASGNVYLAGRTEGGTDIASGGHQSSKGGFVDGFIVKFNAAGVRQWGTYYGGSENDILFGLAIDLAGNVYASGMSKSIAGIATSGAHQETYAGGTFRGDAILVKFNGAGVRQWGTYLGGTEDDESSTLALDASGNIYLAGKTKSSTGIATTGAFQEMNGGGDHDAFLAKFDPSGTLQWGTYFGGTGHDRANAVAVDAIGNVYLAGGTQHSNNLATTGAHKEISDLSYDGFLAQFNGSGARQWATYFGGSDSDEIFGLSTDASGNIYLAGRTKSGDGIATTGAHQNTLGSASDFDAFLSTFDAAGTQQWGTYYGGAALDEAHSVATEMGFVYLAGETGSSDGIAANSSQDTYGGGSSDAFYVRFDDSGKRLWGSYHGGPAADYGNAIAADGNGTVYLAGHTDSNSGIASGGHQNTYNGLEEAFLAAVYSKDLELTGTITPITCKWSSTGAILVEVLSGPAGANYTYKWSNGSTAALAENLDENSYTVTVTSGAGCSAVETFDVPGPPGGFSYGSGANDACYNKDNGKIYFSADGGWGGFTYLWSNGETTGDIENLAPGTYTVTFTDQGGCSLTDDFTIGISGGEPVTFATARQQVNSGEAIEITMDAGMFWISNFIWSVSKQVYAKAEQPLSGSWDNSAGPYTNILESDNLRLPGEVEFLVAPEYFDGCYGDTVKFVYKVIPSTDGVFIPEIYTPNGDGQTDTWNIELPPDFQNTTVTVYNRAGAKVYEGNTTLPWDGRDTPDGTYFYVIQYTYKGQQHALKGAVTILRSN